MGAGVDGAPRGAPALGWGTRGAFTTGSDWGNAGEPVSGHAIWKGHVVTTSHQRQRHPALLRRLEAEWAVWADTRASVVAVRRWATTCPELENITCLAELRAACECRDQTAVADRILLALVREATNGDTMAARVVLQLLLPGAARLIRRYAWTDDADSVEACVISTLAELIATYPVGRRPRHVAANLLLDARHRLHRETQVLRQHVLPDKDLADVLAGLNTPTQTLRPTTRRAITAPPDDAGEAHAELVELFAWAIGSQVLTPAEVALITQTRIDGIDITCLATEQGVTVRSMMRRRQRAEARLRAAVPAYEAA